MIKLTIGGRIPSKKNSRINTRSGRSFPSKKYTEWHEAASWQLLAQTKIKGIKRLSIDVVFYMPDNRIADLSNKFESIADLLVDCGLIIDDRWQIMRPITLDAFLDRERPRAEITLTEIDV